MLAQRRIAVIGLGYVGLTIAAAFGQNRSVIGYDINPKRVEELKRHYDFNQEISTDELAKADIIYTTNPADLEDIDFYIITVPTPLNEKKDPDLSILIKTSEMIGKYLTKGDIVVYESTVYPGATEEECIPALERTSKLKCGADFGVSFSPERVNPGDTKHTFVNVVKVVSATDKNTLEIVGQMYASVVKAGVHLVSKIKTAEATKIIENIQRDINVAYLNEVAMILHKMDLDITEVLKAMHTKWNALNFKPGLVGGHCIGINAHYLTYKAQHIHLQPNLIITARTINESMPKFIVDQTIQALKNLQISPTNARIGVLGLTFKENCPDLKDTMVVEVVQELNKHQSQVLVYDPIANPELSYEQCKVELTPWDQMQDFQAIIVAVAHDNFIGKEKELISRIKDKGVIIDVKGILNPNEFNNPNVKLWQI